MAKYKKKRRYSGCYMCKIHKRFPKKLSLEGRPGILKIAQKIKEAKQEILDK